MLFCAVLAPGHHDICLGSGYSRLPTYVMLTQLFWVSCVEPGIIVFVITILQFSGAF